MQHIKNDDQKWRLWSYEFSSGNTVPWRPLLLLQVGGGEVCGRTTGANALFCFTADTMFAGENEKIPEELLQLEGRLVDETMVGLEGTTVAAKNKQKAIINTT